MIAAGATGLGLAAWLASPVPAERKFMEAKITDTDREKLIGFMTSVIERDHTIHHSWYRTAPNAHEKRPGEARYTKTREEVERQASETVLAQLLDVFMLVHAYDPSADDADELIVTAAGWQKYCDSTDKHGSGRWSAEHRRAIDTLFQAADLDNNGGLSFEEFVGLMFLMAGAAQSARPAAMLELVWLLLDRNHDGVLTRKELEQWANLVSNFGLLAHDRAAESRFARMWRESLQSEGGVFAEADINGDGVVTKAEFMATIGPKLAHGNIAAGLSDSLSKTGAGTAIDWDGVLKELHRQRPIIGEKRFGVGGRRRFN